MAAPRGGYEYGDGKGQGDGHRHGERGVVHLAGCRDVDGHRNGKQDRILGSIRLGRLVAGVRSAGNALPRKSSDDINKGCFKIHYLVSDATQQNPNVKLQKSSVKFLVFCMY